MRTIEDIRIVKFVAKGSVTIDLAYAEQDMEYHRIAGGFDMTDQTQRDLALKKYVAFYFGREKVFADMPSTIGPGEIFPFELEVVNANGSFGTSEEPRVPSAS